MPALDDVIDDVVSVLADRLNLTLTDTDRRHVASECRVRALALTWRNHARHMTEFDATGVAAIRNEHLNWWRTFAFGDRYHAMEMQ